ANLSKTDLKFANFSRSNLSKANLIEANLSEAYLSCADLSEANFSRAILNKACLNCTNLSRTNLSKAELSLAVIEAANLQNADLSLAQALGSNFKGANLTGACLQNWNTNCKTQLDDVECDYIYLKKGYGFEFNSRYPSDRMFQPGEFTRQFKQASEIEELVFPYGITEFFQFFQERQQQYTDKVLAIQELEPKSDSSVAVRLEVLPKANQEDAKSFYEEQLQLVKASYTLQATTQAMELYKQHNAEIIELARLALGKPSINNVNVGATAMSNSEGFTNNLQGANIANFSNQMRDNARQQANQYNYSPETKSLADAAKEIQTLLDHLSQTYRTDTMTAKCAFANEVIQRIDNDPSLTQRILSAFSAGSISALEQFLNHPAASFVINALEDWQKTRVE
ncbi:pentapeptide repeat-containing protein, partial [Brasilonema bromeliae]